jgi:hypothetical protein
VIRSKTTHSTLRTLRRAIRALVLCGLLFVGGAGLGCSTPDDRPRGRPNFENDDTPRCWQQARLLEDKSMAKVERADATESTLRKKEFYEEAIADLKDAQALYERELVDTSNMPPERRRNAEAEIDRLAREVERLYKKRPS